MERLKHITLDIPDHEAPSPILPLGVLLTDLSLMIIFVIGLGPLIERTLALAMRTNGLVQLALPFSFFRFVIIVLAIILLAGDWTFRELGLKREHLLAGLAWTSAAWAVSAVLLLAASFILEGRPHLHPGWGSMLVTWTAGDAAARFFGTAFVEGIIYRGFMISAVFHALPAMGGKKDALVALVISQMMAALPELPAAVMSGSAFYYLSARFALAFLLGLLVALVYLRTGNLFLSMGLHGLLLAPLPLFTAPEWLIRGLPVIAALVFISWGPRLFRHRFDFEI